MLVPSLTVAPLVWLGVHQLLAYNLLLLSAFALSGAAMFLLVRSLTRQTGAALVAGFVFAFLPYRFMHYAHLELQMAQWMPLCLWALHRTISGGRLRDGLLTGAFFALQTLSSFYYGIFFVDLPGSCRCRCCGSARLAASDVRARAPLAAGAVLAAVVVAPFTKPYFDARKSVGERPTSEVEFYSATPQNYLAAHPRNALLRKAHAGSGAARNASCSRASSFRARGRRPVAAALGGAHRLCRRPRRGVRDVARLSTACCIPWLHATTRCPTAGCAYRRAWRFSSASRSPSWPASAWRGCRGACAGPGCPPSPRAALALVFVEYRSDLTLKDVWTAAAAGLRRARRRTPQTVVLELPLIDPDIALEPIYMYFSTFRWRLLVNGYSGFSRTRSPPEELMATFPDAASVAELRRREGGLPDRARRVLLRRRIQPPRERLDESRSFQLVGPSRWEGRETRLYRVLEVERRDDG